jgi:hypothetical protein
MNTNYKSYFLKFDKLWLGLILALAAPVITIFIVYLHSFDNYSIKEFFHFLAAMRIMSKLFSLCVLPNLGIFFLFIWGDFLRGARGVLTATFIVTAVILIIQFVIL